MISMVTDQERRAGGWASWHGLRSQSDCLHRVSIKNTPKLFLQYLLWNLINWH